ncbi:UNVERIFIED_CONTAM: hypothetical protein Slati_3340600 [Sesamum latifolium]|uniref:DUF4005 domain-containing protein n=1 Tax=Sesamum latifolium TaxID=2727402 RepID=A0AAW2UEP8_9LAMI
MGASGKWIKSVIGLRKASVNEPEKGGGKSKKWRLWRSASGGISMAAKGGKGGGYATEAEGSESSSCIHDGEMAAAVAALAKASPKDFMMVRREWAAVRIQTIFRAFLQLRKNDVSCSSSKKIIAPSKVDMSSSGHDWLDRWMATKPWETKSMDGSYNGSSETTPVSRKDGSFSSSSDHDSVRIRRNNISTRISPRITTEFVYDESTTSNSSPSTSGTPVSADTQNSTKPNYMSLTKSIKAKQKPCSYSFHTQLKQMHSVEELPYLRKQSRLSRGATRTSADTDLHSVNLSQDLYHTGRYGAVSSRDYYKQSNEF